MLFWKPLSVKIMWKPVLWPLSMTFQQWLTDLNSKYRDICYLDLQREKDLQKPTTWRERWKCSCQGVERKRFPLNRLSKNAGLMKLNSKRCLFMSEVSMEKTQERSNAGSDRWKPWAFPQLIKWAQKYQHASWNPNLLLLHYCQLISKTSTANQTCLVASLSKLYKTLISASWALQL